MAEGEPNGTLVLPPGVKKGSLNCRQMRLGHIGAIAHPWHEPHNLSAHLRGPVADGDDLSRGVLRCDQQTHGQGNGREKSCGSPSAKMRGLRGVD